MTIEEITPQSWKNLGDLQDYIAECSSVVRDKAPKSSEKLFERLLTESIGDTASRVLEYIPCRITSKEIPYGDIIQLFGFTIGKYYYSNARELLNWGWTLEDVLKTVNFDNYRVFKCVTPYFIYGQVSTHTQLTTVSHSQRYAECDRGYWMPPEISGITQDQWNAGVSRQWRPIELVNLMKKHGIVRKEILDRGKDMLQRRVFTIGGYTNNPNAWPHFLDQRTDLHTQYETRQFAEGLDGFIFPDRYTDDDEFEDAIVNDVLSDD